ncbi:MAG: hypothetical protein HBSAPP03_18010 [Phycisphaerae bacterium]|nr:MAG: hypothetical protein HBSAPP03_18010 [Phycisphaerae bacterium]
MAALCLACVARGEIVRLRTGDVLVAAVASLDEATVTLEHPVLGVLTVSREQVVSIESGEANTSASGSPAPSAPAAGSETEPASSEAPLPWWKGWRGAVDVGLNGSSGNSDALSGRVGVTGTRATARHETAATATLSHASASGAEAVTRAAFSLRNDWKAGESRWGFFALGRAEYDDAQDWTWRVSGFLGPSYRLVTTARTSMKARLGLGGSHEFGGARERTKPEGLLGMDASHALNERAKVFAIVEVIPNLTDVPHWRLEARAGYEVLLDPARRMNLKVGVADRYTSDPGQADRNDLEYFVTVGWAF